MNLIRHKRSSVTGKVPTPEQLLHGEIALNTTDVKIYTKTTAGDVAVVNSWENIHNKPAVVTSAITEIAANPTTADVAINTWAIFRNTSTGAVELWANNNGTMVKVALA